MSDFQENEKLTEPEVVEEAKEVKEEYHDELDQFTSIFADPEAHNDKPRENGKRRITAIIAAFLAVAVLVGGTIAVIKLIPELEDDEAQSSVFEDIKVVDVDSDKLSTVTVKNSKGEFKFYSVKSESTDESSEVASDSEEKAVSWLLDGVEMDKTSSSEINSIISSAATVTAMREIETKTAADCGLDNPVIKVDVQSDEIEGYSILVGIASPDGTGTYLKLSTSDKIYLVDDGAFENFQFEALDLANTSSFAAASFTNTTGYTSDDGTLNSFDELSISGKNFGDSVKIRPADTSEELQSLMAFEVAEPMRRFANDENVLAAFGLFTENLAVAGAYSYDIDDASLAAVGLDNPDLVVSLTVGGETKTFKIAYVDDEYCAVINDNSIMIRKVAKSNISFAGATSESFYSTWVIMQMISDVKNMTVTVEGTDYSFDITYDDAEDAEEPYVIMHGDKKLDDENFRDFYQIFVGLMANSFKTVDVDTPATTVKLTLTDKSVRTLELYKISDTAYQFHVDGKALGTVTSSAYNKFVKNVKLVAEDKKVAQ